MKYEGWDKGKTSVRQFGSNKTREEKIQEAFDYCDSNDKSTAFMLQFAQDYANCSLDEVIRYFKKKCKETK